MRCLTITFFFSFVKFETLDVGVQEEFEKYLQDRGIGPTVASFIPEYAAHKEQQVCPFVISFTSSWLNFFLFSPVGICKMAV